MATAFVMRVLFYDPASSFGIASSHPDSYRDLAMARRREVERWVWLFRVSDGSGKPPDKNRDKLCDALRARACSEQRGPQGSPTKQIKAMTIGNMA